MKVKKDKIRKQTRNKYRELSSEKMIKKNM